MSLAGYLQDLAKKVIKICENWKRDGKIRKEPHIYVKHKVEKFEYNKGNIALSSSFPVIVKEKWHFGDIFNLIITVKKNIPEYKKTYKHIAETYDIKEPQADFWLFLFVQKLITTHIEKKLSHEEILDIIVTFIKDLDRSPIEWNLKVWLEGIWLDIEEISIEKGITIRKPQPSDLEYEYPVGMPLLSVHYESINHPSAVLEITKRTRNQSDINFEIEKIILALQLYKIGSVNKILAEWRPKSILNFDGTTSSFIRWWTTTYKYPITKEDVKSLPQFVKMIKPLIPTDNKTGRPLSSNPIGIAILRYQDSLFKPEAIENKIAYTIMGLEALYLKANEREELSHRLAQRTAKIMEFFNEPPIKVYSIVKNAYEIRSSFVHGSPVSVKDSRKTKEILDKIIDYLRKSIFIFLQIGKEKEEFINLIDNAILETKAYEKLKKLLKETIVTTGGKTTSTN